MARKAGIIYPIDYSIDGTQAGRVVDLFNHGNPVTGHMTIKEYNDIRAKFETLRSRAPIDAFERILTHMAGDGKSEYPQISEDMKLAEKSGVTMGAAAQRSVAYEWKNHGFSSVHKPDFKVQIGEARQKSAVTPEFYESMGGKVEAFRSNKAGQGLTGKFEDMIRTGSAQDLIWPEHWAKEHGLLSVAGVFSAAVKSAGITNAPGLSLETLRTYIKLNPAPVLSASPTSGARPEALVHS